MTKVSFKPWNQSLRRLINNGLQFYCTNQRLSSSKRKKVQQVIKSIDDVFLICKKLFHKFQVFYYLLSSLLVKFIRWNIINMTRMRNTDILIGTHVWSCQNDFCWNLFIFVSVNMTLKTSSQCINWSYSIGYFEKYVNFKSDYLELLFSVYRENFAPILFSPFSPSGSRTNLKLGQLDSIVRIM